MFRRRPRKDAAVLNAALLAQARAQRAELAGAILRTPHGHPWRWVLRQARRLAMLCEEGARENLEESIR